MDEKDGINTGFNFLEEICKNNEFQKELKTRIIEVENYILIFVSRFELLRYIDKIRFEAVEERGISNEEMFQTNLEWFKNRLKNHLDPRDYKLVLIGEILPSRQTILIVIEIENKKREPDQLFYFELKTSDSVDIEEVNSLITEILRRLQNFRTTP